MKKLGELYNLRLEKEGLSALAQQYNAIIMFRRRWFSIRVLHMARSFFGKALWQMDTNQRNYELSKQLVRRFRRRLCVRCLEGLREATKEQRGRIVLFAT